MRKEAKIFNWTLEGVTAQYAGEILFDVPETRSVRQECRDSYLSCLDDWFFAIIYGDSIEIASPGMVGDSRPGHDLIDLFSESVKIVSPKSDQSPKTLLEDVEFRTVVGNDLQRLDRSLTGWEMYWRQWITREAAAFFGDDSSVFEAGKFGEYHFKKKPPLIFDKELVKLIPERPVKSLSSVVEKHLANHYWELPHRDAIQEFVLCNFLTLITISRWYDTSASLSGNIHLPSRVRSLVYHSARIGSLDSNLERVRSTMTRNALGMILETNPDAQPHTLMELAYELREDKRIIKVRQLLSTLFQELEIGPDKSVNKLVCDISTLSQRASKSSELLSSVRIEREWQPSVERAIQRVEKTLGKHRGYYINTLERLFPELFGKPSIIQSFIMKTHINQYGLGDNVAGDKVMGDKIDIQVNNSQDLWQAAKDIQDLLNQLSKDYPHDSNRVLGARAIDKVENNPELQSRIMRGLKAGSFAALKKMIDHPVATFFIEGTKEILKP
ncbi:hypothetical protein [Acaryochloris sp. IP29b_bin.137]|uniref:hypothetical protein n=1 Tax=Acaryochloris sp. IP29b_bin.137 TaxID=2969217 RepID=UPI0026259D8E|nr:hypothetical protein [Acaryochloris sp. IP29b_bin.137]